MVTRTVEIHFSDGGSYTKGITYVILAKSGLWAHGEDWSVWRWSVWRWKLVSGGLKEVHKAFWEDMPNYLKAQVTQVNRGVPPIIQAALDKYGWMLNCPVAHRRKTGRYDWIDMPSLDEIGGN